MAEGGRIELLKTMLQGEPNDPFCLYALGLEYVKSGELPLALEWFDKTIEADPDYCYAYFHKAKAQASRGDPAGAKQTIELGLGRARASGDSHAANELETLMDDMEDA